MKLIRDAGGSRNQLKISAGGERLLQGRAAKRYATKVRRTHKMTSRLAMAMEGAAGAKARPPMQGLEKSVKLSNSTARWGAVSKAGRGCQKSSGAEPRTEGVPTHDGRSCIGQRSEAASGTRAHVSLLRRAKREGFERLIPRNQRADRCSTEGERASTNAVARKTPVPKWRKPKRIRRGHL
jgi:hypothetical protein